MVENDEHERTQNFLEEQRRESAQKKTGEHQPISQEEQTENMPLTVASFKEVARSFESPVDKNIRTSGNAQEYLTKREVDDLRLEYSCLEDQLFEQILVVRKNHRHDVTTMMQDLVGFRHANDWQLSIKETDIHPRVRESGAHFLGGFTSDDKKRPIIYYKLHKIDAQVATPKDFQLQCQYMIQEASKLHPCGEVAVTLDFEHASFSILTKLSPQDMKRGMALYGTYPVKVKRVYVKNSTAVIRTVAKALLALTGERTQSKVTFLPSTDSA